MQNLFSKNLNYLKKVKDLSNSDLMDLIGLTSSTISNLLNEKSSPNLETLMILSQEFDYTIDELIGSDISMFTSKDHAERYNNRNSANEIHSNAAELANMLSKYIRSEQRGFYEGVLARLERLELIAQIDNELKTVGDKAKKN